MVPHGIRLGPKHEGLLQCGETGLEAIMDEWRIGVDIGGTFMDFCALEVATGRTASLKVLTTPEDPGAELRQGLDLLAEREGIPPEAVSRFVRVIVKSGV